MSKLQKKKQERNASVLFNLHESCFTNINYDIKVYFTTKFSLTL